MLKKNKTNRSLILFNTPQKIINFLKRINLYKYLWKQLFKMFISFLNEHNKRPSKHTHPYYWETFYKQRNKNTIRCLLVNLTLLYFTIYDMCIISNNLYNKLYVSWREVYVIFKNAGKKDFLITVIYLIDLAEFIVYDCIIPDAYEIKFEILNIIFIKTRRSEKDIETRILKKTHSYCIWYTALEHDADLLKKYIHGVYCLSVGYNIIKWGKSLEDGKSLYEIFKNDLFIKTPKYLNDVYLNIKQFFKISSNFFLRLCEFIKTLRKKTLLYFLFNLRSNPVYYLSNLFNLLELYLLVFFNKIIRTLNKLKIQPLKPDERAELVEQIVYTLIINFRIFKITFRTFFPKIKNNPIRFFFKLSIFFWAVLFPVFLVWELTIKHVFGIILDSLRELFIEIISIKPQRRDNLNLFFQKWFLKVKRLKKKLGILIKIVFYTLYKILAKISFDYVRGTYVFEDYKSYRPPKIEIESKLYFFKKIYKALSWRLAFIVFYSSKNLFMFLLIAIRFLSKNKLAFFKKEFIRPPLFFIKLIIITILYYTAVALFYEIVEIPAKLRLNVATFKDKITISVNSAILTLFKFYYLLKIFKSPKLVLITFTSLAASFKLILFSMLIVLTTMIYFRILIGCYSLEFIPSLYKGTYSNTLISEEAASKLILELHPYTNISYQAISVIKYPEVFIQLSEAPQDFYENNI